MRAVDLFLALLFVGAPWSASATLLYDNGVTETDSYIVSDNSPGADQLVADDFALSSGAATITNISWRGTYGRRTTPAQDNFKILIHSDDGGRPSVDSLFSFDGLNVIRSLPDANFIFTYAAEVSFALAADTRYWISIFEELPIDHRWAWIFQFGGDLHYRSSPSQPYNLEIPYRTDFQLSEAVASVPEPSVMVLALAGLVAAISVRARSARRGFST